MFYNIGLSMRVPGKTVKISWMMLSRVGVQYLNASYGWWTVCPNHRKEYLDAWQVGKTCCHPVHKIQEQPPPAGEHMVKAYHFEGSAWQGNVLAL
jgi:hypothetical protein